MEASQRHKSRYMEQYYETGETGVVGGGVDAGQQPQLERDRESSCRKVGPGRREIWHP